MKTMFNSLTAILTLLIVHADFSGFSQGMIHSVGSGSWNNPLVWDCTCVPDETNDVAISEYNFVIVTQPESVNNLEIFPNAELILEDYQSLSVHGNVDAVGTFTANMGEMILNGNEEQYVDGGNQTITFFDLTIDNQAALAVTFFSSDYILRGTLKPLNGSMILDTENPVSFTFPNPEATAPARIARVENGFTFSGSFTVENDIPAGANGCRDLSSALNGATFSMWDASAPLHGPTMPDGCADWMTTCESTISYLEAGTSNLVEDINAAIEPGTGYEILLGTDALTFEGAVLSATGTLNETAETTVAADSNWTSIGNPYVSSIDFNKVSRTGLTNYFYVYSTETGNYEWYDAVNNTSSIPELANGVIARGQGFYVCGTGSVTFADSCKTSAAGMFVKTDSPENRSFTLELSQENSLTKSSVTFTLSGGSTDGFDSDKDILLFSTGKEKAPLLSITSDQYQIRKNYYESDGETKEFILNTDIKQDGDYIISLHAAPEFDQYRSIVLTDLLTGETTELTESDYHFSASAGDSERFILTLSNESLVTASVYENSTETSSIGILQQDQNLVLTNHSSSEKTAQLFVYDTAGHLTVLKLNLNLTPGNNTVSMPELQGMWIIVVESDDERTSQKVIF